jgi:hypothetical protein
MRPVNTEQSDDTVASSHPVEQAIVIVGKVALARGLGVTHQAFRRWFDAGRMPRTEWTGETRYSEAIERLTDGRVTKAMLLGAWPPPSAVPHEASPIGAGEQPRQGQAHL